MTLTCDDWRGLTAREAIPLISAEARAWRSELEWDVTESWRVVEPARAAGQLPGFVVRDASGAVAGWTCFVLHRGLLQVMTFVASDFDVSAELLSRVLTSKEAECAQSVTLCVRDAAVGLRKAVAMHGFDVTTYRYLTRPIEPAPHVTSVGRAFRAGDDVVFARLAQRAYVGSTGVRAFAPNGTPDEWREYVLSLTDGNGCGRLMPRASLVVPDATGGEFEAGVLTTRLADRVAHIGQLVVAPEARGRGLARQVVTAALAEAATLGCRRATLLVSTANRPAAALYERLGFQDAAAFVVASTQPRRSNSLALAAAGARTRR